LFVVATWTALPVDPRVSIVKVSGFSLTELSPLASEADIVAECLKLRVEWAKAMESLIRFRVPEARAFSGR
jgi:hypothetical protein